MSADTLLKHCPPKSHTGVILCMMASAFLVRSGFRMCPVPMRSCALVSHHRERIHREFLKHQRNKQWRVPKISGPVREITKTIQKSKFGGEIQKMRILEAYSTSCSHVCNLSPSQVGGWFQRPADQWLRAFFFHTILLSMMRP